MEEIREKIRQSRLEHLRHTQLDRQDAIDTPQNIIQLAIERRYPGIDRMEAEKMTRQLVLAPKSSTIKIGGDERKVSDLQYEIAGSIETNGSETTSEYYDWFLEASDIIKDMNDGFVNETDLKSRNEWIEDSYNREAELMTCLGLYQSCAFPAAKEKAAKIYNKLVKLRQIRSSIQESTGNEVDKPKEVDMEKKKADHNKAIVYVAAVREFMKYPELWNMNKRTLKKLKIYHGEDEEFEDDYDDFYSAFEDDLRMNDEQDRIYQEIGNTDVSYGFDDSLKENILFHWDDDKNRSFARSEAEDFIARVIEEDSKVETKESIADHIARLSGRKTLSRSSSAGYDVGRARAFSGAHYNSLAAANQFEY